MAGRDEGSPLGPDCRRYSITPQGRDRLARWADALLLTERSLRRLLDTYHTQRTHRSRRKDAYSSHDLGAHRGAGYKSGEPGAP